MKSGDIVIKAELHGKVLIHAFDPRAFAGLCKAVSVLLILESVCCAEVMHGVIIISNAKKAGGVLFHIAVSFEIKYPTTGWQICMIVLI